MKSCGCPIPQASKNPRKLNDCEKCGRWINPAWTTNDTSFDWWFDRLAITFPAWPKVPLWFEAFRDHCHRRERAGRSTFRLRFLDPQRDGMRDAAEEAADGANYHWMEILKKVRRGDLDNVDVHLTAMEAFAKAHRFSLMATAKERGNTGPAFDE